MKAFLRYAVLGVVSVLAGLLLGYLWGRRSMGAGPKIMSQMYALGEYETLASLQYQQANSAQGKQALLDLLDFMRRLEGEQGNAIGSSLEIDRGITYTRLALLEEHEGNREKSQDYIRQAQESFRKRSNNQYSEAQLRDMVAKLDSKSHYALPAVFNLRQARK
jgi:hypothetical protein